MKNIRALATRPPVPERVLDLLLRQDDLQPHLDDPADLFALSACSQALRAHHPWAGQNPLVREVYMLEAVVARPGSRPGDYFGRMTSVFDPSAHGSLSQLLADTRDTVWMADEWRHGPSWHPRPLYLNAERRRVCLAYLFAVTTAHTYEEGLAAVDEARQLHPERLLEVMHMDFTVATTTLMAASIGAATVHFSRRAAASSAAAWHTGATLGKAKAMALATGAATGATLGILFLGVTAYWGASVAGRVQDNRKEAFAGRYGKDAMLCELLTGRPYARSSKGPYARRC